MTLRFFKIRTDRTPPEVVPKGFRLGGDDGPDGTFFCQTEYYASRQ